MLFFHSVGNVIIPTDELAYFFRGVGQPPTRKIVVYTPFILIFWYIPHEISTVSTNQYELWYSFSSGFILIFPTTVQLSLGMTPAVTDEKIGLESSDFYGTLSG